MQRTYPKTILAVTVRQKSKVQRILTHHFLWGEEWGYCGRFYEEDVKYCEPWLMLHSPTEAYFLAGDEKSLVSPSVTGGNVVTSALI